MPVVHRALPIALAVSMLTAGCAPERVNGLSSGGINVTSQSRSGESQGLDATAQPGCAFHVVSVEDLREHKSLGQAVTTKVDGENFPAWFNAGLTSMPGHTTQAAPVELRVEVLKAYIHALSTMKSANLVVRVHFQGQGTVATTKTYRGVDDSTNWSSSQSEIQLAFDNAIAHLRQQLMADIGTMCRQRLSMATQRVTGD